MIAKRVKLLRRELRLTQSTFGARLGTSKDVIANIEYGRVAPRPVFLEHICSVYNVNRKWLLDGEGEIFADGGEILAEAMNLMRALDPAHREYVLRQIRGLVELQQEQRP